MELYNERNEKEGVLNRFSDLSVGYDNQRKRRPAMKNTQLDGNQIGATGLDQAGC